ncbi:unnamed protein product [Calypogeia fissa]
MLLLLEKQKRKAVKKSGETVEGREIFCDIANERAPRTPGSDFRSPGANGAGTPRTGSDKTAFVKGFDKFQEEESIRNGLSEHFSECGEVVNVRIPTDRETGEIKGFAYVEFGDKDSFTKALELDGSKLGGRNLVINEAGQPAPSSGGFGGRGEGRGGDRGGRGGRFGGGGRGGGGRFGGGGDRGRGGRGGGRGDRGRGGGRGPKPNLAAAGTGKKITFGDD